jgi:lipopolysaccharide heptosyltransferase II
MAESLQSTSQGRWPRILKPPSDHELTTDEERILVIRFSSLGDILLTAPALRALHRRFPESHIDLLVVDEYQEAASLIPGPDRVLSFDRRSGLSGLWRLRGELTSRYVALVDLQNSFRSAFLRMTTFPTLWMKARRYRLKRWLLVRFKRNTYRELTPVPVRYLDAMQMFDLYDDERGLELSVSNDLRDWATDFLAGHKLQDGRLAILCPGSKHFTKRWPEERWRELGAALISRGYHCLVIGGREEQELTGRLTRELPGSSAIHDRSVPQVAALMERATVVITNDSGLMHLATGVDTPTVAIFGPTVEEFGFYPFRAKCEVIEHKLYCRPCSAMGGPRCPEEHFRCMLDTSVGTVLAAIDKLMVEKDTKTL